MKKSFFFMMLIMTAISLGTLTVSAAEPKTEEASRQLEEAKTYYIGSMVVGFNVGRKIAGGEELSAEQTEAVRQAIAKWVNADLIPFLEKRGVLEEWITMQSDKDVRKLNRKAAEAKSMDEIVGVAKEGMKLTKLRYPNSFASYNTKECAQVMQKLQICIMQALVK